MRGFNNLVIAPESDFALPHWDTTVQCPTVLGPRVSQRVAPHAHLTANQGEPGQSGRS